MAVNIISAFSANINCTDIKSVGTKSEDQNLQEIASVFSAIMNTQTDVSNTITKDSFLDRSVENVKKSNPVSDSYERYNYKDNQIKKANFQENKEETVETLEKLEENVVDAIQEEFGVGEEEIQSVLEKMGISILDLLQPQNLADFVMELTGVTAKEELLLNVDFLNLMGTMDSLKQGAMKELDTTSEGFEQLVELMEQVEPEEIQLSEAVISEVKEELSEEVQEETQDIFGLEEDLDLAEYTGLMENQRISGKEHTNKSQNSSDTQQQSQESFMTMTSNLSEVQSVDSVEMASYLSTDTMELMEQIVEQVKLNITTENNTMEMQLNPENLGKLHVSISEKNGVINAEFTATSELVKEALESQLATLRENLNQAGVKVDAIEVTVGTHQFESNLEQNQKREENEGAYQEELVQKRRNLHVNTLDELSGLMSEEELLAAQIMKDNGNSVDFMA